MKVRTRWMNLFLAVCLLAVIPVQAAAAVEPRDSSYFMSHAVHLEKTSDSAFQIWFDVDAVDIMDELGASTIHVYRSADGDSWTKVRTFNKANYLNMTSENAILHFDYVTYTGAWSGYYYRASITFYASLNGSSGQVTRNTKIIRM